jgi:hypothetical protein
MEVNVSPSLNTDSQIDKIIKTSLLCDTFTLIGMTIYDIRKEEAD